MRRLKLATGCCFLLVANLVVPPVLAQEPAPGSDPAGAVAAPGERAEAAPAPARRAAQPEAERGRRAWWAPLNDRGWMGVRLGTKADLDRALAAERLADEWLAIPNLDWLGEKWDGAGAMVVEVLPESPAEKAGLLPGDVVQSFNGIRTQSPGVLVFVVQRAVAGHDGDMEVLRDGETRRVLVEIGMHPEDKRRLEEEKEAAAKEQARGEQPE